MMVSCYTIGLGEWRSGCKTAGLPGGPIPTVQETEIELGHSFIRNSASPG